MTYSIWITTNCNMKCLYCYEGDDKPNLSIDIKRADEIISFITQHFKTIKDMELSINYHGGEPFLNFSVMEYITTSLSQIYKYTDIKLEFHTTTNATIMSNDINDFILLYMPDITISIDGTPETQSKMRPLKNGENSYKFAIKNSLKLLEKLPDVRVRMTFDTRNVQFLFKNK